MKATFALHTKVKLHIEHMQSIDFSSTGLPFIVHFAVILKKMLFMHQVIIKCHAPKASHSLSIQTVHFTNSVTSPPSLKMTQPNTCCELSTFSDCRV